MPSPRNKQTGSATVKVRNNKRKKVVKTKYKTNDKVSKKTKSVTNKKTGVETKTTISGKGKNKTKSTEISARGLMPMLRKLAPDSPMAKQAMKAIKKPIAIKAKRLPKQKLAPMAPRAKMVKKK